MMKIFPPILMVADNASRSKIKGALPCLAPSVSLQFPLWVCVLLASFATCVTAFAQTAPVPSNKPANYPAWWFDREIIKRINPANTNPVWPADYPPANDYAALNQGQLKWLARKAQSQFLRGVGPRLDTFLDAIAVRNLTFGSESAVMATQSSTGWDAPASRAIDGNADGNFYNNSVSTTNADLNPWWQVSLGSLRTVHNVEIWNRTDCCGDRTSNFYVFVSQSDMSGRSLEDLLVDNTVWKSPKITNIPNPHMIVPVGAFTGRFVMVRIEGVTYLSLAEVKVTGGLFPNRPAPQDYASVNLGQLKSVAKLFYDRLKEFHYVRAYPWETAQSEADDYALANIGQAKSLFAFDTQIDSDGDGLPDMWERANGLAPINPADAAGNVDKDSLTNLEEFSAGKDPLDYYNGQAPVLTIISGDGQHVAPGEFLAEPLRVCVSDFLGGAYEDAPVNFAITKGNGTLDVSIAETDPDGIASVNFQAHTVGGAVVTASVRTGNVYTSVEFRIYSSVQLESPQDVFAETISPGVVEVSWTPVGPEAAVFRIERSENGINWNAIGTAPGSSTTYLDVTAPIDTVCSYRIIAADY